MKIDCTILEPGLALSSHPKEAYALADLPIEAILNVCDAGEPSYVRGLTQQIQVVCRPFEDCWPVPFPWVTAAVLELAELRRHGKFTLVHCLLGRSRSPTIVALYWMARDDIDWRTAVTRLQAARPCQLIRDGQSPLVDDGVRKRIVAIVKRFLDGENELLREYRQMADKFATDCTKRPADAGAKDCEWNLIEDGLAIGESVSAWPVLEAIGFERILVLRPTAESSAEDHIPTDLPMATHTFPDEPSINATVLRVAVHQLSD